MASSARIDELKKKFDESPRRYFAPLANEYRKAGDFDQAIAICREFLPQQPSHMSGHIVYGQALFDTQQFEEARTVFDTALTLDPENLIALRSLGDIARYLGDLAGARNWYQRVLEADPRNDEIASILTAMTAGPERFAPPELPPEPAEAPSGEITLGAALFDVPSAEPPVPEEPAIAEEAAPDEPALQAETAAQPAAFEAAAEVPAPAPSPVPEPVPEPEPVAEGSSPLAPPGLPADELFEFEDLHIRHETPVLPPFSASSFTFLGVEIERNESFMPRAQPAPPEAEPEEPIAEAMDAEEPTAGAMDTEEPHEAAEDDELAGATDEAIPEAPELSGFTFEAYEQMEAAAAAAEPAPDPFATETMAELYLSQGHAEDALQVYRALLAQRPGDAYLERMIAATEAMTALTPAYPMEAVPGPAEPEPVAEAAVQPESEPELELEATANVEATEYFERETEQAAALDDADEEEIQDLPDLDVYGFGFETPAESRVEISETTVEVVALSTVESEPEPETAPAGGPSIRDFLSALATHAAGARRPAPESPRNDVMAVGDQPEPSTRGSATPAAGAPVSLFSPDAGPPGPQTPAEHGGSIDGLFGAGAVAAPDQAAAATLAGAFGVVEEEPPPPLTGAPARRATEELSLDNVFRESQPPSAPQSGGFSFDRFFEGSAPAERVPEGETPTGPPAADAAEADIEQFNSWLQGLKKR